MTGDAGEIVLYQCYYPHTLRDLVPFPSISIYFGIGASFRIGQEIQCVPYAGFLVCISVLLKYVIDDGHLKA